MIVGMRDEVATREGLKKVDCVVHKSVLRNSKIQSNLQ